MAAERPAPPQRRGSDLDGVNEQQLESWVDRFLIEMSFSNMSLSGNYPKMYGRLNWVKAFGSAGENACFPRLADMPLAFLGWRLFYLLANFAILVDQLGSEYDNGRWFYYLTNWQLLTYFAYGYFAFMSAFLIYVGHPSLVKMPVSSVRFHGDIMTLLDANQKLLNSPSATPEMRQRAVRRDAEGTNELDHPLDTPGERPHYAIHVQLAKIAGARCPEHMPLPVRITWMLQGIAFSYGLWVTFLFWVVVAPTTPLNVTGVDSGNALISHGLGFVLVIVDFVLNNIPWLLPQSIWCLLYAAAYIIWTGIHFYYGLSSKYSNVPGVIYPPVNWHNWPATLFVGVPLVVLGGPLSCFLVWFFVTRHRAALGIHGGLPWIDLDGRATDANARRVPRPWWCCCCR